MQITYLDTYEKVLAHIEELESDPFVSEVVLDVETTGLDHFSDRILQIVLSGVGEDQAVVFGAAYANVLTKLSLIIVAHNCKFDLHMLYRAGVDLRDKVVHDTMLMHHLIDENQSHALDSLVKAEWDDPYKELFWAKYKTYEEAPLQEQVEYAGKDVIYTRRLYNKYKQELAPKWALVEQVHSLAKALLDVEIEGINVDVPYLMEKGLELKSTISRLQKELRAKVDIECLAIEMQAWLKEIDKRKTEGGKSRVAKPEFSFDSTKQLSDLIYNQLKLPLIVNKKKNPTTDEAALEQLKEYHPVVEQILEYRGAQKVYGSYIEGTLNRMRSLPTGENLIFPSFNVNGTVTGRQSSSDPNMHQLPKEGGIRGIYIPKPGEYFISADYKQLEVCIAAHFSQDKNLLKIVFEGASQHDITAEGLGIPRGQAKTINFAMQYGATVHKIQKILKCSPREAQLALNKYWETYAGLKASIDQCHKCVEDGVPIINPFGRARHFPKHFETAKDLERAKRQAFNALVQGTGADLTTRAFISMWKRLKLNLHGRTLFPIHDEILLSILKDYCQEETNALTSTMKLQGELIGLTVPLSVDASIPMVRWQKG